MIFHSYLYVYQRVLQEWLWSHLIFRPFSFSTGVVINHKIQWSPVWEHASDLAKTWLTCLEDHRLRLRKTRPSKIFGYELCHSVWEKTGVWLYDDNSLQSSPHTQTHTYMTVSVAIQKDSTLTCCLCPSPLNSFASIHGGLHVIPAVGSSKFIRLHLLGGFNTLNKCRSNLCQHLGRSVEWNMFELS